MNHVSTANETNLSINVHATLDPVIDFAKYSNWRKLVRIVAYVLRFPMNIRSRLQHSTHRTGVLSQLELTEADNLIYRQAQLEEFSEEMSILMCSRNNTGVGGARIPKSSSLYNLSPFLDANGVLRMRGRIAGCQYIEPSAAHTILLPRRHPVTILVVQSVHERDLMSTRTA
ncbi:uncharacterized protein LOC129761267 [Toxorhynchites rutilus septentrionalis]|uniref:uncharacterized protein LOC129761267 n=1 Tax=Toxorhynchites rutilus septentrionalis TaxID=329112 RepID=UPI0024796626|nr:uncharacterized protein LOC129761267 [Toxorhynchites rutilus septentrionalis]